MSIQFVTGADDRMFLHTLILLQTFANVGAAGAIKVCDFGFTEGQRSFLKAHGLLLVADPPIPQSHHHPWYRKAALVEYIARDVDTVVWLDCDVMLTGDPRSEVAALVSEMRQSGEIIAACDERFDLGTFCRSWETKGKNMAPFVRLLHQLGVASHHPYLNSGVFVAASRGWLAKWKEITFDITEHFLFEQNAFNAAAWLAPEHVRLLDRRHWNLHGSDLDRISIGTDLASLRCDDQQVMVGGLRSKGLQLQAEANKRAERLRRVFEGMSELSARQVAKKLNEDGVKTPDGGKWHATQVIRIREPLRQRRNGAQAVARTMRTDRMTNDIKDIGEKEFTKLYAEYQAGLGRPMPVVVHRQGRNIPGCVSTEASGAWKLK